LQVFSEYVQEGVLTIPQAIRAVEDIFFNTSNDLYDLELPLIPLPVSTRFPLNQKLLLSGTSDLQILTTFLEKHPTTKFIRMQWIDYTATARLRVIPTKRALAILQKDGKLQTGVTEAGIVLLQNDTVVPGIGVAKEHDLTADFSSLRLGPSSGYASVYSTFNEKSGEAVAICPRATLERVLQSSSAQRLDFLIGFEIEIVFMSRSSDGSLTVLNNSAGHAWSSSRALQDPVILAVLTEIYDTLADASIELDHFEPESSPGQYEFVLPPYPPMESCDTLLHTREIITTVTAKHGLRATMIPKPFKMSAGTASHVHLSISSPGGDDKELYESFYAGVLKHMQSIIAFTYSNPASYDRMVDSCWAGGRWVTWGTQNKETALRKIEGSHFEIKVFDGLANVYLAVAAILAAGTEGVKNQEVLKLGDCRKDPALLTVEERSKLGISELLPSTLVEAIKKLEENKDLQQLLGEEVVKHYVMCKEAELKLLSGMEEDERRTWIMERY
jgi:glutamine synthetase